MLCPRRPTRPHRSLAALGCCVVVWAAPATAAESLEHAQEGFENGVRLDLGFPVGKVDGGSSGGSLGRGDRELNEIARWRSGIWADLGYRSERWWWGAFGQIGLGGFGDLCPAGAECHWSELRLGVQAHLKLSSRPSAQPWIGAGVGYEWLRPSATRKIDVPGANTEDITIAVRAREKLSGPQVLLQGGLDLNLDGALRAGPFLSLAVSQYLSDSFDCPSELGCPTDSRLDNKAVHAWFSVGMRASYGP